jgi:hypothetical protein
MRIAALPCEISENKGDSSRRSVTLFPSLNLLLRAKVHLTWIGDKSSTPRYLDMGLILQS